MAAILRFTTPLVGRWYTGGATAADVLDFPFAAGASAVTAQLYPLSPASQVTNVTLAINGNARNPTSSMGQNPCVVVFSLGGDMAENPGALNTLSITATDNQGGNTAFSIQYFRMVAPGGPTTTPMMPPLPPPIAQISRPVKKQAEVKGKGRPARGKK
jgi:hypothetical protein